MKIYNFKKCFLVSASNLVNVLLLHLALKKRDRETKTKQKVL
jgi:hypothetical protein